jgi:hypothetical protein
MSWAFRTAYFPGGSPPTPGLASLGPSYGPRSWAPYLWAHFVGPFVSPSYDSEKSSSEKLQVLRYTEGKARTKQAPRGYLGNIHTKAYERRGVREDTPQGMLDYSL